MVVIQINNKKSLYVDFSTWVEHNDKCRLNRKEIERNIPNQLDHVLVFLDTVSGNVPRLSFRFLSDANKTKSGDWGTKPAIKYIL